jgi:hypothetical protein
MSAKKEEKEIKNDFSLAELRIMDDSPAKPTPSPKIQ